MESLKENVETNKSNLNLLVDKYKLAYRDEEMGRKGMERALATLKSSLEEKKKQIESFKTFKKVRIPAQFLASQKLAMDKRRYSPSKSEGLIITRTKRSISARK